MSKYAPKPVERPNTGRRSFILKAGAAASAVLATAVPAVSMSRLTKDNGVKGEVDCLTGMIRNLEEENKIRDLHKNFEYFLDNGRYEDLVNLFISNSEVKFNGGLFRGKEKGVERLFCELFRSGETGRRMASAPGFELNNESRIEIFRDCKTAKAQFPYSIQVGTPIISNSVLVKMARLQGGGTMKWWEGGIYRISYVKGSRGKDWRIKDLEFRTLSKADYRPGRSCAKPIEVPAFSKVYPDDPAGPDRLYQRIQGTEKA